MPGLAHRNDQFSNGSTASYSLSANVFWSRHGDDVSYNQLQKFWSELSLQARQELLRIDKQTLFEQARKNMYCSRCNGLLLEGFLQIVMYGKSLQQEGAGGHLLCNRQGASKTQNNGGSSITQGCQDEMQDPSVHPWGGLITTRDGSLTLMDCYLYAKSLKGLQNVFDSARVRERERELLYPDACGGSGRGWISQGITSYGRGHGIRETCALHTARLSCDTLLDFWSALGEETRQSLLRMKEEDFIERLMYRFDSKRFCRDCRRNVIREFKELKELKRLRREPRCTSWFCVADTAFQCEVSDDTIQADWRQTFSDTVGTYHHFEWAVGTGEGKSDILEFENVGMDGSIQVSGLDLGGLNSCFITLKAWKLDGRCTELFVKAHGLKGHQCVHCRLVVGDGFVTITRGESIRRFFEHAEEAEEEEDDDSMDKDGNELDGECSRPQKHAKSPELAREFLLDAATVIFKEQVEKAFREGTARQNAHSIFVCLALKLLEERVHVACKEIITLEKQMKLLEEEEKEKREEEARKERRRTKEREKKLRRKERLKEKEKDKEQKCSESNQTIFHPDVSKEESSHEDPNNPLSCRDSVSEGDTILSRPGSPDIQEDFSNAYSSSKMQDHSYDSPDGELTYEKDWNDSFTVEQLNFSRRRPKFQKEVPLDPFLKWSDRRRYVAAECRPAVVNRSEPRYYGDNIETPSRGINGSNRQLRMNVPKSNGRHCGPKFNDKFSSNRLSDRYDLHSCSCNQNNDYRPRVDTHISTIRVSRETKAASKLEPALDMSKQFYRGNKYNQIEYLRDGCGRPKNKIISGNNPPGKEVLHPKKVWEPLESQKKYPRSNSDSEITLRSTSLKVEGAKPDNNLAKSSGDTCCREHSEDSADIDQEESNSKGSGHSSIETNRPHENGYSVGAKGQCNLTQVASEEIGLCPLSSAGSSDKTASNRILDPIVSTVSSSDNFSACLSEGDSNTASSNHGNLESSSTSDSEDASQQSEGREACIQNGMSECHVVTMVKNQNSDGRKVMGSSASVGLSLDGAANATMGKPTTRISQNFDSGLSAVSIGSQHQGMLPPMHNQNIHFPVFQASSTMGFYHQNPVSWPAAHANGLMPFPHTNPYLYAGPHGYGINGNSRFCMQYGPLQHVGAPVFKPSTVPIYQPVAKASGRTADEPTQISKSGAGQEAFSKASTEKLVPTGPHPKEALGIEGGQNDNSAKLHLDNSGFSLFHFDGPFALSTGCKSHLMPPQERIAGDFSQECPTDHESDHSSNKNENTVEEYNLFATSNGIRFSFFQYSNEKV
ncbi:hypothetical protein I3843_09G028700 [Carya illinoinensis]|uniref:Stress response protein NST1 n=3 Tax=Carya illinoinensis TaxID=32201 RepID=A0A922E1P9_CARIL|nr:uncharacterized protein LOC122276028 [Carya illinoinensis]KAG6694022.1 hypothetical protein I3842_09G028700 [Carya illinoinensis]KAG7961695.1 hypothetical protein I3843_09G028700 [Carya illinoinensis]